MSVDMMSALPRSAQLLYFVPMKSIHNLECLLKKAPRPQKIWGLQLLCKNNKNGKTNSQQQQKNFKTVFTNWVTERRHQVTMTTQKVKVKRI